MKTSVIGSDLVLFHEGKEVKRFSLKSDERLVAEDFLAGIAEMEGQAKEYYEEQFGEKPISKEDEERLAVLLEQMSLGQQERLVSSDFRTQFVPEDEDGFSRIPFGQRPFVREVFDDFVLVGVGAKLFRVEYTIEGQDVTFDPREDWQPATLEVQVMESDDIAQASESRNSGFGEHYPVVVNLIEDNPASGVKEADILLIRPGAGNSRDKNFYPADVLKRDAHKFEGVPMFATNHNPQEQTPRNRVATIVESGKRFTEDGEPIARIAVQKEWFWNDLKLLERYGLLHTVHNSIMAEGKTVRGQVGGQNLNIVTSIDKPRSVDFVAVAGAGGHVMKLIEDSGENALALITTSFVIEKRPDIVDTILELNNSKNVDLADAERTKYLQEIEAVKELKVVMKEQTKEGQARIEELEAELSKLRVIAAAKDALTESKMYEELPEAAQVRVQESVTGLTVAVDEVEAEVTKLIEAETTYIKSVNGTSGKVTGLGGDADKEDAATLEEDAKEEVPVSIEERDKNVDAVLKKFGVIS